jgi:hypothetical protein
VQAITVGNLQHQARFEFSKQLSCLAGAAPGILKLVDDLVLMRHLAAAFGQKPIGFCSVLLQNQEFHLASPLLRRIYDK